MLWGMSTPHRTGEYRPRFYGITKVSSRRLTDPLSILRALLASGRKSHWH